MTFLATRRAPRRDAGRGYPAPVRLKGSSMAIKNHIIRANFPGTRLRVKLGRRASSLRRGTWMGSIVHRLVLWLAGH
jgi:hypothetical protein